MFIAGVWKSYKHAWLSGGYSSYQRHAQYDIYTFTEPDKMTSCGNMMQEIWYPQSTVYYMNWGYGGRYDGYYSAYGWTYPGTNNSEQVNKVSVIYNISPK